MPTNPRPSLADAMFPSLSAASKQREAAQSQQAAQREQDRQLLLRLLRETREGLRADKERGR
jgi:hypothetical protein